MQKSKTELNKELIESVKKQSPIELIQRLLDQGADINAKDASTGKTPLIFALTKGANYSFNFALSKFLLDHGADMFAVDNKGISVSRYLTYNVFEPKL